MQDWFYVQSGTYGNYYIRVEVSNYGTYKITLSEVISDGLVGHAVDYAITLNKSYAKRKYIKFAWDAELDIYGWNGQLGGLSWEFDVSDMNSVKEYVLSNPRNIKAASYMNGGINMKKYVKASSDSRKIPYDLVSALVILRDYADVSGSYVNDEHEKLVDIADTLYNVGIPADKLLPEFKAIYDLYGEDYFDRVLNDASAIDSQIHPNNVQDLIDEYSLKATEFENGDSVESATKINCVGHNDPGQYFDLIDYFDVWGNEEDGWEVNDQAVVEEKIWISDDITEEELFNYLKDTVGYFNRNTKFSDVEIQWYDPDFIEIFQAKDGCPVCSLRKSYTE